MARRDGLAMGRPTAYNARMTILLPALAVVLITLSAAGRAAEPCRVGVDLGSSGFRLERQGHAGTARADIATLKDVWANGTVSATVEETVERLNAARRQLGVPMDCRAVGGGYSAWRLAVDKGGAATLAAVLRDLRHRTGIAVLVVPQDREGAHAFHSAALALGSRLRTGTVLDLGGGSLQVVTSSGGRGVALGQKSWLRLFCERIRGAAGGECAANPVGEAGETAARSLLAGQLAGLGAASRGDRALTAVSIPVTRGLHPALRHLAATSPGFAGEVDPDGFDKVALDSAIALLRDADDAGIRARLDGCRTGCAPRFAATLVTDMLLVGAVMESLEAGRMEVAEADVNNVAGLLADPRAEAWAARYPCYLSRLAAQGVDAYGGDPSGCPPDTDR